MGWIIGVISYAVISLFWALFDSNSHWITRVILFVLSLAYFAAGAFLIRERRAERKWREG